MSRISALLCIALSICSGAACSAQTYNIVQERNGLLNVFAKLKAGSPVTIAYFGGSITAGAGATDAEKTSWRALTSAWISRQYPNSHTKEVNASVGGTGSEFGAFRLQRDVLSQKPDLVFVEFAVNDFGAKAVTIDRAVEGIVRQIRTANPETEICFVYTLCKEMLSDLKLGLLPKSMFEEETIAAHYHLASVNVGAAAAELINSDKMTWAQFSKDTCHPTDAGYSMYADTITGFLAQQSIHVSRASLPYRLVEPLTPDCWASGNEFAVYQPGPLPGGWQTEVTKVASGLPPAVTSGSAEASPLTFAFSGSTIGICYVLGPDTGNLEYKIDNGAWVKMTPFDDFAIQYARLQYRILNDSLKPGAHSLQVKPAADKDARSKGTVLRLLLYMADQPARS